MIDLARKLSDCDEKYFGGWVIAGMELKLHGKAEHFENSVLLAKEHRCVHEARGYDAYGNLVRSLRLFLVLPKTIAQTDTPLDGADEMQKDSFKPEGELVYSHSFAAQEINDYAAATGDENIIHKGDHPLVPGICMLNALQKQLKLEELSWKVSFLAPVYAGEELQVFRTEKGFTAYVKRIKAFIVKI